MLDESTQKIGPLSYLLLQPEDISNYRVASLLKKCKKKYFFSKNLSNLMDNPLLFPL